MEGVSLPSQNGRLKPRPLGRGFNRSWFYDEKFLGLDAIELAIPSFLYSYDWFIVTVSADVQKLSDAIFQRTGKKLQVSMPEFEAKSGIAYLVQHDDGKSSLVCGLFEE
ncbi:MAG: hypothetical protein LBJ59_05510 [Zoogloeaceae bacterium]|nr:hypothetical protein [Zoogloeaceae bacterium]